MPTLIPNRPIPTGSYNSLFSHPLYLFQQSRLQQPMPQQVYSLPMQPMPQQVYSLPMQPMQQQVYSWPPLQMPPQPMQLQTLWQPYYPSYQPQPMPMQQVEEKMIVQSIYQNPDGNFNKISFPKSQIDQEFQKKGYSQENYDIRYRLTQNYHGTDNLDFVFVQKQRVFAQFLNTIQHQNNQTNYCGVSSIMPMANNFAPNHVAAYPILLLQPAVVVSKEVGPCIPSPVKTPAPSARYQNVDIATLPGNTPPDVTLSRVYALHELSRQNLFLSPTLSR